MYRSRRGPVAGPRAVLTSALALTLAVAMPAAFAQSPNGGGQSAGDAGTPQQQNPDRQAGDAVAARHRLLDLRQQISDVQKSALDDNPDLQKQQESLRNLVRKQMKSRGVDPDADISRMREIAQKLRSGKVGKKEQKDLAQEYEHKRKSFLDARRAALSTDEVRTARDQFRKNLLAAMQQEEPKINDLLDQYRQAAAASRDAMRPSGHHAQSSPSADGGGSKGGAD